MNTLDKHNIGKIAERIIMNEFESRGYRATDLNKDGLSANSDILVAKNGKTWQIQVKGATNKIKDRWWIQYGHCNEKTINKESAVFNSKDSFYKADYVAFVAIKSPSNYRIFIMPSKMAEQAAQLNLDRGYRTPKKDGGIKKPGKIWIEIEGTEKERKKDPLRNKEREILQKSENKWDLD